MESSIERAKRMRILIEKLSTLADDNTLLEAPEVCRHWRVNEDVVPGDRRFYPPTNKLYKVKEGMGHTTQASWAPDLFPAAWAVVALPTETGTLENPIEASRGMDYEYGLYYKDPEDTLIYLCEREGATAGDTINLQFLPHELVGHYFTLVE